MLKLSCFTGTHIYVNAHICALYRRVIGMLQSWQQETRKRLRRKALLFFVVFVLLSLAMAILDPAR